MTTPYFSYGANMDPVHMAERCPGAVRVGRATLTGHRFAIAFLGFGTVHPDPDSQVLGVLWLLTPADVAALDAYEGIAAGQYQKRTTELGNTPDGTTRAMLYYAADGRPGRAQPGYLERIVEVADMLGFPGDYVASLKSAGTV